MKTCCIVVIGHVDHGKTALVQALTGTNTDRLPEEKKRGLSITPGFAHCTYPTGIADFIDAPGHEDFIHAMISGASGASAALVVVSAVEGIAAQTIEHLQIAELLGIDRGVIAVTKSDLLPASGRAVQLAQITQALAATSLRRAEVVFCSARTAEGIDRLQAALAALIPDAVPAAAPLTAALPVDRAFSMPGRGTVVTGTLLGRSMALNDAAVLQPGAAATTIRGLQSRSIARDRIMPGERMAANLRGIAVGDVPRGAVLCFGDDMVPSSCVDVGLAILPGPHAVRHMDDIRVLIGTASEVAQLRLFGAGRITGGQTGMAQLRFKRPVTGFAGQRAILRQLSPAATIGGAILLDPCAQPAGTGDKGRLRVLQAAQGGEPTRIAAALCDTGGRAFLLADLARLARLDPEDASRAVEDSFLEIVPGWLAARADIATTKAEILAGLARYHDRHPLRAMAPRKAIRLSGVSNALWDHAETALAAEQALVLQGESCALVGHDPRAQMTEPQRNRMDELETLFRDAGLNPPKADGMNADKTDADLMALLTDSGRLVPLINVALGQVLVFHTDALAAAAVTLARTFSPPETFTTGQARTALATSRRVIVPVLEYFDSIGVTQRQGDTRSVAQPISVQGHAPKG